MTMKAEKTIWVTKYWETKGILKVDAEVKENGTMASWGLEASNWLYYAHGNDFHLTEEAAFARVEVCRQKKMESLNKKLDKLKAMAGKPVKVVELK